MAGFEEVKEKEVQADPKYGQLDEKLVNFLRKCEFDYFREDLPVPFCGLLLYPVQVRNYEEFANCCSCLTLDKNKDPKGIANTHLGYLIGKTQIKEDDEGRQWSYRIQRLFELVFHIDNGLKCKKCGKVMRYNDKQFIEFVNTINDMASHPEKYEGEQPAPELSCPCCGEKEFIEMIKISRNEKTKKYSLFVDGHEITSKDFANLRQIILYQNYPDYADESWIDPAVKRDHDEKMRLERMRNDLHATIEKKVVCLSISTHYDFKEIYDMSIRKFTMALTAVDDLINYKIMKQATMSGFVSLPKGKTVEHWIYKPDKDLYGDSYKTTDEVQGL